MDARGGKLLEFLRENNHLDLEVPDIAFSVKKSEKTVEAALQKLQQKGLVTARQNEYGRVYWYALPSAPITRTFKLDELKEIKEEFVNDKRDMEDEEVDLSELQVKSAPKQTKKTKKSASAADVAPASVVEPERVAPVAAPAADIAELPQAVKVPAEDIVNAAEEVQESGEKVAASTFTLPVLIVVGLISLGALARGCGVDGKIAAVQKTIPQNTVASEDLTPLKTEIAKIGELEKKIASLSATIDSLKLEMEKETNKPPEAATAAYVKKKPLKKRK